jgi:heme-degrading monooxygenase HmoA
LCEIKILSQIKAGRGFPAEIKICTMILELAILDVIPGKTAEFEASFASAQKIISSMKGWRSHQLQHCLESPNRYLLLVEWETLSDHTVGFRGSAGYQEWKKRLHHFYDPFPVVEHYTLKFSQ